MADPTCYVIAANEWHELVKVLAAGALLVPIAHMLITTDWHGWMYFFRRCARRRRIRAIRQARS